MADTESGLQVCIDIKNRLSDTSGFFFTDILLLITGFYIALFIFTTQFNTFFVMQISTNQILDNTQIQNIVRRIAYQIYEINVNEEKVILAGIEENGFLLAEKIKAQLEKIAPIQAELCAVKINKKKPLEPVVTSLEVNSYKGQSLVLIDDVLNSGTTLIYGVKHFLDVPLKRFKTAVLVNRNHKKYPVKADFKGISLSTSLKENITVIFEKDNDRAVLD